MTEFSDGGRKTPTFSPDLGPGAGQASPEQRRARFKGLRDAIVNGNVDDERVPGSVWLDRADRETVLDALRLLLVLPSRVLEPTEPIPSLDARVGLSRVFERARDVVETWQVWATQGASGGADGNALPRAIERLAGALAGAREAGVEPPPDAVRAIPTPEQIDATINSLRNQNRRADWSSHDLLTYYLDGPEIAVIHGALGVARAYLAGQREGRC